MKSCSPASRCCEIDASIGNSWPLARSPASTFLAPILRVVVPVLPNSRTCPRCRSRKRSGRSMSSDRPRTASRGQPNTFSRRIVVEDDALPVVDRDDRVHRGVHDVGGARPGVPQRHRRRFPRPELPIQQEHRHDAGRDAGHLREDEHLRAIPAEPPRRDGEPGRQHDQQQDRGEDGDELPYRKRGFRSAGRADAWRPGRVGTRVQGSRGSEAESRIIRNGRPADEPEPCSLACVAQMPQSSRLSRLNRRALTYIKVRTGRPSLNRAKDGVFHAPRGFPGHKKERQSHEAQVHRHRDAAPAGRFGIPGASRAGATQSHVLRRLQAGVRELPRVAVERDRPVGARREERRRRQHVPDLSRRRHGAPQGSDEGEAAQPVRQGPHGQRTDGGLPHLPLGQPQSRVLDVGQAPAQRSDVRELPQHPRGKAAPELQRA